MINLIKVESRDEGQIKAHELLTELVGPDTLLALSGGTSSDYRKIIVNPGDIKPVEVCMVDERYGMPFHQNSNELLIKKFGMLEYLASRRIPFTKILEGKNINQTELDYDMKIRSLFAKYEDKVAVIGVGANVHTAGIFPHSKALKSISFVVGEMVDDIYPQRITMTLKALDSFTHFIIMMFGEEKRGALKIMLDTNESDLQSFPAIYLRKCQANAHLITNITT